MSKTDQTSPIAIIGMGCIFPQSHNLKEYWRLLLNGIDAIQDIPEDTHWTLKDYYDKDPATPDHTYCTRGGFIPKVTFDPLAYGIPPNNLEATDTSQLLGLEVARMALEDAGYPIHNPVLQQKKVNVILGVTGTQELVIPLGARLGHPIWKQALKDSGIPTEKQEEILDRISGDYVQWQENSFPGLLGNVVAGRIANRLNLNGTNSVSDAACASSLSAIHTAIMELSAKKCDMSITGGVDSLNDIFMHMCFSKTGVLSHTSDAKPFSKDADGTVLGEGIGMLVLKRLEDAEKDNDRIYAVIKGIGTSSDGKTSAIYAPEAKGQLRALNEAYQDAQIDPATVELVEAHGTGTRVGDNVEFTALKECYGTAPRKNQTAIGSVKSMIGHTKAAAGAAGIIKTALALHHKTLPPTLKANEPDPELEINPSAFYLNNKSKPWVASTPRRSGISAFGFGGSNFHAVLEEYSPEKTQVSWDGSTQIFAFSSDTAKGLKKELQTVQTAIDSALDDHEKTQTAAFHAGRTRTRFNAKDAYRLLIVLTEKETIEDSLTRAFACIENQVSDTNVYFSTGAADHKIGFLFPGQGSQYPGMSKDLVSVFPEALDTMNKAADIFAKESGLPADSRLQEFIFPLPEHLISKKDAEQALRQTNIAQPAIGAVSSAMTRILERFNVKPDMTCGHSFGELSALAAARWLDDTSLLSLAVSRGKYMARAGDQKGDPGSMLAVQAPLETIEELIKTQDLDLVLANQNSLVQGVLSGATEEILRAKQICRENKIRAIQLPVAAAFHSRLVETAAKPFATALKAQKINATPTDVLSNTTGSLYQKKEAVVKEILGNQLANPVRFIDNIQTMVSKGITTFIEVGPKAVLSGLVKGIVEDSTITAISVDASSGKKSGVEDLAHLLCSLAAKGIPVDLNQWEDEATLPETKKMRVPISGANPKPKNRCDRPKSEPGSFVSERNTGLNRTVDRTDQDKNSPEIKPKTNRNDGETPLTMKEDSPTQTRVNTITSSSAGVARLQQPSNRKHTLSTENPSPVKPSPVRQGSDMTHQNRPHAHSSHQASPAFEAIKMVQKGLEAMQQLQSQTARTHEKFLDTQAQATQTLAGMLEQTKNLAFNTNSAQISSPVQAEPVQPPAPLPVQEASPAPIPPAAEPEPVIEPIKPDVQKAATPVAIETPAPAQENRLETPKTVSSPDIETAPGTQTILFDIVSNLTGFPVEMLEPDMDIESDMGIDSIKKVEIISELEKQIPSCEGLTTETIGSVRTLNDICTTIDQQTGNDSNMAVVKAESEPSLAADDQAVVSGPMVSNVLFNTISELTGFPVEMLEPDMNLESDLGIDSIKRVEILSKLEQELDDIQTISSDDIAGLKTIHEIINYLSDQTPETPTGAKKKSPESEIQLGEQTPAENTGETADVSSALSPAAETESMAPDAAVTRQVIHLKEYPTNQIRFYNGAKIDIDLDKTIYITQDSAGLAPLVKEEFEQTGITAELIDIRDGNTPDLPDAAGLVILTDAFCKTPGRRYAMDGLNAAFRLVKQNAGYLLNAAETNGAFLTSITFMGGDFGYTPKAMTTDPIYGGLAGLIKTAQIEMPEVLCRALDLPDSLEQCKQNIEAATALMMTHGSVEMGLDGESCNIPTLNDRPVDSGPVNLSNDDVVVITGGAKGVTAACAIELAKQFSPKLILMGRSALPESEPAWLNGLENPAELKKAILANAFSGQRPKPADLENAYQKIISNREIKQNIRLMEEFGSTVDYYSCDICDANAVKDVFKQVEQETGPITALIHGAGVKNDKRIVDKEPDSFKWVLSTKIDGLDALLGASDMDQLKYLVLFSSVAARCGNQGQSDYATANEVLNKTAQKLAFENQDCKVLSLNWGPWEGGMVDETLQKEFLKRGVDLIPLKAGAQQMINEMGSSAGSDPEVVIGAQMNPSPKKKTPKLSKAMAIATSVANAPILSDHQIDNTAVVPFALLMEYHAQAAEKNNPGLVFAGMDYMKLRKGVKLTDKEINLHVNIGKCTPEKNGYLTAGTITSDSALGSPFIHSTCEILLNDRLPKPPVLSNAAFMSLEPYPITAKEAYDAILFHGKGLQSIKAINGYSKKGIEVITGGAPHPDQWFNTPEMSGWVIEPMMLDAAFQAAILWCHEVKGQVCLPNGFSNFRLYSSFKKLTGDIRILFTVNEETKNKIKGYFTFLNQDETVVASITGFEAITDPALKEKFKNTPLFSKESILAFAQGNPSDAFGTPYSVFDTEREIARLPRPPYFFMDRVLTADHPQWEMKPGGWIETEYDIPETEWYFDANHTETIPFCILLEIALQPCGWLAAYSGSALHSEERLHFRNLGGKATMIKPITRKCGTITIRSRMTEVSKAGGMIIQDFDMEMLTRGEVVYKGTTNFGFFSSQALANQVGIRNSNSAGYRLPATAEPFAHTFESLAPVTPDDKTIDADKGMPSTALRMIDEISALAIDAGGLYDKGYIMASKTVNPEEWFFDAHFYQDPVCPGSLGVESFLQMLRFYLLQRFDIDPSQYAADIPGGQTHEWIYRGQIIPKNKKIEIHAHIKSYEQRGNDYMVTADGALVVDDICIYEMKDFQAGFFKTDLKTSALKKGKMSAKK